MLEFLNQFYLKFDGMKDHDLLVTGESYSGKYVPNIAKTILDSNKLKPENEKIPLKSIMIGDGLMDIVMQRVNVKSLPIATGYLTPDILP